MAGKPPTTAVDDLDLEIEPGEFLVLLGPSGCGKTTTLRCIAGLETADDGRDRTSASGPSSTRPRQVNVPPNKRNIGMVFQSYALWPHMTVRKNIGYPLKARAHRQGDSATEWIEETAASSTASALLDRYPAQLSGGQQQRVALARGLVARPELVLFDEPLEQPRRAAARPGAHRDPRAARPPRLHRRLRHPRPGRGARARRPARDHARRRDRAARDARGGLRGAGDRVRRRLHRHGEPARARAPATASGRTTARRSDGDARRRRPAPAPTSSRSRAEDVRPRRPDDAAAGRLALASRRSSSTRSSAGVTCDVVVTVGDDPRARAGSPRASAAAGPGRSSAGQGVAAVVRPGATPTFFDEAGARVQPPRSPIGAVGSVCDMSDRRRRAPPPRRSLRACDRWRRASGSSPSSLALGYLTLAPARPAPDPRVRARRRARTATPSATRRSWQTVWYDGRAGARLARDRARARHGARLGGDARCLRASGCCAIVPILPIVVPAVASVLGWAFLLSPRPGYLNAAAAAPAVVERPLRGPVRHLHAAVDHDHHRARARVVHLPVRQRRASRTSTAS